MKYVKKSAQILSVDDSEVEKFRQQGFEEWAPPDDKAGVKSVKNK
jgi:hypothetical protein